MQFYEDQLVVAQTKVRFLNYAKIIEPWLEHSSGMHQMNSWVALAAEGFGANLQHYNPVIDEKVLVQFGHQDNSFLAKMFP